MSRPVARSIASAVISAVLLSLPFHFSFLWPLSFVGLIPYFFSLEHKSRGGVVAQSYLVGVVFSALVMYWLNYVSILAFILTSMYVGGYWSLFGFFSFQFFRAPLHGRSSASIKPAFYVAGCWVILEWIRGCFLSGIPWALLGYSQWKNLPFIQLADVTGVWGISFAIVLVNYLLYQFAKYKKAAVGSLYVALSIFALLNIYGFIKLYQLDPGNAKPSLRLSVVQGNIPQDQKWDSRVRGIIFEKYKRLTFLCANELSDLVIWPETSFPGFFEDEPVMAAHLRSAIRQAKSPTLVGAPTLGDLDGGLRFYNSAILFGQNGEESQRYSKTHLVPFGEFVPLESVFGIVRHFVPIGNFSPGREKTLFTLKSRTPQNYLTARFGVMVCYEDIFPQEVRETANRGADFLVNITNDAWFGNSSAPYQHTQASVFRAVENRLPVIRAANTGLSCFISSTGKVTASVSQQGKEIMVTGHKTEGIYLRKNFSLYRFFGDWLLVLCLGLVWVGRAEAIARAKYSRL